MRFPLCFALLAGVSLTGAMRPAVGGGSGVYCEFIQQISMPPGPMPGMGRAGGMPREMHSPNLEMALTAGT